jgi:hypothetical protein
MITLYSDRRFIKPGGRHAVMLYPFWGKPAEDPAAPQTGRFDRFVEIGPSLFSMAPIEQADLAVVPVPWEDVLRDAETRRLAYAFIDHARGHGKRIALFCHSDSSDRIPFDDVLIFRTSFYRSKRRPLEFAQPAWTEDFVEKYLASEVRVRTKGAVPSVGFCGYAGPLGPVKASATVHLPLKRRLRRMAADFIDTFGIRKIRAARGRALTVLDRSKLVDSRFILRNDFLGPTVIKDMADNAATAQRIRDEYVANLLDTDYTVCARGHGNFSIRLFETLSCGRIPIFIDTDCPLPFENMMDWSQYVVRVREADIDRVDEIVTDYHASLSPDDFVELQHRCRELWLTLLSPSGFFNNFDRHLEAVGWLDAKSRPVETSAGS